MKTVIKFNLMLLSVLLLAGCGVADTGKPTENAKDVIENVSEKQPETVNQNVTKEISVIVPDSWEPVEGSVLSVQYMKNTASFMAKKENFSSNDLDTVVKEAKTIFEKTFKNVEYIGGVETIQVDGLDARKFVFTSEISGLKMKYLYVYTLAGSQIYAITFGDLTTTFDNLSSDYNTILGNIKFK